MKTEEKFYLIWFIGFVILIITGVLYFLIGSFPFNINITTEGFLQFSLLWLFGGALLAWMMVDD